MSHTGQLASDEAAHAAALAAASDVPLTRRTRPATVATLPAAAAVNKGARALVTDATVTTFASNVVGGGANTVPVYSDGANWKIG